MSWKIWETYNAKGWTSYLLTLAETTIRSMEYYYYKIFFHPWMPSFIQSRIELLKIPIRLEKLADFIQDRNEMLLAPSDVLIEEDFNFEIEKSQNTVKYPINQVNHIGSKRIRRIVVD